MGDLLYQIAAIFILCFLVLGVLAFAIGVWALVAYILLVCVLGWTAFSPGTIVVAIALGLVWLAILTAVGGRNRTKVETTVHVRR